MSDSIAPGAVPIWKNPLVVGAAATCGALVVAIAAVLAMRTSATPVAQALPAPDPNAAAPAEPASSFEDEEALRLAMDLELGEEHSEPRSTPAAPPVPPPPAPSAPLAQLPDSPSSGDASAPATPSANPFALPTTPSAGDEPTPGEPTPDKPAMKEDGEPAKKPGREKPSEKPADDEPAEEPPEPAAKKKLLPPPSGVELEKTRAEVHKLYESSFRDARTPVLKVSLARQLLGQTRRFEEEDAATYVLLDEARRLGEEAGDFALAFETIDRLAATYEIERAELKFQAFGAATKLAKELPARTQLAQMAVDLIPELLAAHRFDLAEKMSAQLTALTERLGNAKLREAARSRAGEIRQSKQQWTALERARKTLESNPDDAEANTLVGRQLCLVEEDFAAGLPLLAKGNDSRLRDAAQLHLANPTEADAQLLVADAWHDLATSQNAYANLHALAHGWYLKAYPSLTGLERIRVEVRVKGNPKIPYVKGMLPKPAPADADQDAGGSDSGDQEARNGA